MKKLFYILSSLLLLAIFPLVVNGQTLPADLDSGVHPDYYPPSNSAPFQGQNHSYSVVFRGNGEAVVNAKIILTNKGDSELSNIDLRVPKVEPDSISIFQQIREPTCKKYTRTSYPNLDRYKAISGACPNYATVTDCNLSQSRGEGCSWYYCVNTCLATGSSTSEVCERQRECEEYNYPNFYSSYGQAKYQKAEWSYEGDTINITLPEPIVPGQTGSFLVYYRAFGYASKVFASVYNYEFETLKVDDEISNLQVGITTDSDLVLKNAKGKVNYRFDEPAITGLSGASGAPLANTAVDSYYRQIGYGQVSKSANNLAPLESYKVKGTYAGNNFILYYKEILIGLGILVAVLGGMFFLGRKLARRIRELDKKEDPDKKETEVSSLGYKILAAGGIGFVSAFLIAAYTIVVILLGTLIMSQVSYRYDSVLVLFLILISIGVYALLMFGPPVYFAIKKGVDWGIRILISTVIFLFGVFVIALLILIFIGNNNYRGPIPLLGIGSNLDL